VKNIKRYLIDRQGFAENDMLVLMDDGSKNPPTKKNIEDAFARVVEYSNAGDVVFIHYSGHGGRVKDLDGTCQGGARKNMYSTRNEEAGSI
jgi:hypothetical protein